MLKKLLIGLSGLSLVLVTSVDACGGMKGQMKGNMSGKMCHQKSMIKQGGNMVNKVIKAVSQTGLSAAQTKQVADGIAQYQATIREIKAMRVFPIDSFMHDDFNETRFIAERSEKSLSKIAADAALFKYIFSILDKEQRKVFKNAYAAPVIEQMIRRQY